MIAERRFPGVDVIEARCVDEIQRRKKPSKAAEILRSGLIAVRHECGLMLAFG